MDAALLGLFLLLFFDVVSAVDEELGIEVIDFVLDDAGVEVVQEQALLLAFDVGETNEQAAVAFYFPPDPAQAQAALFAILHFFAQLHNFGVDHGENDFVFLAGVQAHNAHAEIFATLGRRDADPVFVPHGFGHFIGKFADFGRDFSHGL